MSVTSIDKDPDALTMTVTAHLDATVTETPDTGFTFKVGYKAGTYGTSSASYTVTL